MYDVWLFDTTLEGKKREHLLVEKASYAYAEAGDIFWTLGNKTYVYRMRPGQTVLIHTNRRPPRPA